MKEGVHQKPYPYNSGARSVGWVAQQEGLLVQHWYP